MSVTVLFGDHVAEIDAQLDSGRLWVAAADLAGATGWERKPEGLCREEACIALPADSSWEDGEGRIDASALAAQLGRPVVSDAARGVWACGESAQARGEALRSGMAPDFALPDLQGQIHRLSDYRGQKVFVYTYGSYCGCSFDLPNWQVVYDELSGQGFVVISVALDAGGAPAVENRILAPDLAERPEEVRRLMGWNADIWARQAVPEYPCLIDTDHVLADLYNMTNVPMAFWVDEEGRIVRPTEAAAFGDNFRRMDEETFVMPDEDAEVLEANRDTYIAALRDWVANGADSYAAMSAEQVQKALRLPSEDDARAAVHARMGTVLLSAKGDNAGAEEHFRAATQLSPGKWNYRRQSMSLTPELVGELNVTPEFWTALNDLGEGYYYPPVDLPGIRERTAV